ncbi:MAG: hypothetical protein L0210_10320 [Rhodospirillales bacterium]|nr:hypothetical protein [Rhodospirillales bacterium]
MTSAGLASAAPRQDIARGILLMLAAVAVFSTMDALIKHLTATYSPLPSDIFSQSLRVSAAASGPCARGRPCLAAN